MAVINSTGWPITKRLTPVNKAEFLDGLIKEEILLKRQTMISAFGRGMQQLGVLSLIRNHFDELKDTFVFNASQQLTPSKFIGLIESKVPDKSCERRVYKWFLQYIHMKGLFLDDSLTLEFKNLWRLLICVIS